MYVVELILNKLLLTMWLLVFNFSFFFCCFQSFKKRWLWCSCYIAEVYGFV